MECCKDTDERIDAATGMIAATCPDSNVQQALLDEYSDKIKRYGKLTASIFVIGSLLSYLKETMDLTRNSMEEKGGAALKTIT
jgi:hypothetical protein